MRIARFLEDHPSVTAVYYAGLPSHQDHDLAKKQMPRGAGGMLAFDVVGGVEGAQRLVESLDLVTMAVSLGGTESLIVHPASTTHSSTYRSALSTRAIHWYSASERLPLPPVPTRQTRPTLRMLTRHSSHPPPPLRRFVNSGAS